MRYEVHVRPNAKENRIEKQGENKLEIWIKATPIGGKANKMLLKQLQSYFNTKNVEIITGHKSRDKIISVEYSEK